SSVALSIIVTRNPALAAERPNVYGNIARRSSLSSGGAQCVLFSEAKYFAPPELQPLFGDPGSINIRSLRDGRPTASADRTLVVGAHPAIHSVAAHAAAIQVRRLDSFKRIRRQGFALRLYIYLV